MSDAERTPGTSSPTPGTPTGPTAGDEGSTGRVASSGGTPTAEYAGPGAWGPAAMWLLGILFVLSAAATVHSILATFGG